MKFQLLMSKYLLKKGILANVLAISMPSNGIFSCSSFVRTLQICSVSPLISILHSSIDYNMNIQTQSYLSSYFVMDKTEFVTLIVNRSPKLRSIRQQTANSNQQKKGLFVLALKHLLQDRRTQQPAYQEITQLLSTGSLFVANMVHQQLATTIIRQHCQPNLDEYIILWGRMLNGTLNKKSYPNLKKRFQQIKIKHSEKELSTRLNNYLTLFQKNFNQRNDQRVEFFEDFDDSVVSESMDNNSQLFEVFYMNIMEIKAARKKLQQKLPEQALNQQLNKLRYFLSLQPPRFLSENQYAEYQKQCQWARKYLDSKQNDKNNDHNVSINQTLVIQGEVQEIEIVNKDPKPRIFKQQPPLNRQFFEDSIQISDRPEDNRKSFKSGHAPTPIKMIDDPRYVEVSSRNNSLEIHNGHRFQHLQQLNSPQIQENKEEVEEQLIIHKIKPQTIQPIRAKQVPDFSVTENYFSKKNEPLISSPRAGIQSQTMDRWGGTTYMTPTKLSRCKLSKFTSEKKARKQVATKDQLSASEPYVIQPYLQHFQSVKQFARFRRNCFDKNMTIIGSQLITVNCLMQKEINSKIRIEVSFVNNSNLPLQLQTVYKIPKCFAIQKRSKVSKRFTLHNHLKHIFCLDVEEFPLQPCLISIRSKPTQTLEVVQAQVAFPLTLLNFIQYLCITEEEWSKEWRNLANNQSNRLFYSAKHIQVDKQVVGQQIDWLLKDTFVRISSIQGYSVQDYGCICFYQGLQNLKFILRLSVRVDNLVSLQMISCRPTTKNQQEFMDYCMNLWMMLLGKLYV